jgi:hypothetical protein
MIKFKRGTTAKWYLNNEPLADGQPGYDKDKHKIKIGDKGLSWAELPYASGLSSEEILSSEEDAKTRRKAAMLINPLKALFDSPAKFTYGTEFPDENTVGEAYLQCYDTEPEVDYVVESGVNKNWHYKKYKSGTAICTCTITVELDVNNLFENSALYYSDIIDSIEYPISFIKKRKDTEVLPPTELATLHSSGNLVWLSNTFQNEHTNTGKYSILSPTKITNTNFKLSFYVSGYWR